MPLSPPPEDPEALHDFPSVALDATTPLHLVHGEGLWPWEFSCDGSGRFDLAAPGGTCHFALEPLGALLEACCRERPEVDPEAIRTQRLSTVTTGGTLRLADVNASPAFGWGVTGEIGTIEDYAVPRRWAAALRAVGFDGIRYRLRHDPSLGSVGVALFGAAGEDRQRAPGTTRRIGEALLEEAWRRFGVRSLNHRT